MNGEQVTLGTSGATGEERFWQLYDHSLRDVHGFLARRCDTHTAEDLTQEVFLEVARRVQRGEDISALTTGWLITVARSRLIDHFRAQRRRDRKLRLVSSQPGPSPTEDGADLGSATELALRVLAEDERRALLLHHLDGMSITEVADVLGRSVRGTESLLARARRKFRAAFREEGR